MTGCCGVRWKALAGPLALVGSAIALVGLLLFVPSGPQAVAADASPRATGCVQSKDQLTVAVNVSATTSGNLTVRLVGPGGKVLGRQSKTLAGGTTSQQRFQFDALKVPTEQVVVRCQLGTQTVDASLGKILLIKGHETTLSASPEYFAGSSAALRCEVRGVKNVAETVPLPGAEVAVVLSGPDRKPVTLYTGHTGSDGLADVRFEVPELPSGTYKMEVVTKSALGEDKLQRDVQVKVQPKVLLTTDKPLYQPGQTIHLRALALRAFDLKPAGKADLLLEVEDARGNKVFKKELKTSEFGIASCDFLLADEVNMGDWRVRASLGEHHAEKTVSVKKYVLPKFKVAVKADKSFYLPKETVKGTLQADYFFGKPLAKAKVKVVASTFDVAFKEFSTWEGTTDDTGGVPFEVKLPDYFVGTPLANGNALVRLEVTVTDSADHAETVSKTYPVSGQAIQVSLIPEAGRLIPGVENRVFVAALYPDGSPAKATVEVFTGREAKGKPFATQKTNEAGLAEVLLTPKPEQFRQGPWGQRKVEMLGGVVPMNWVPSNLFDLTAQARDDRGNSATATRELTSEPLGENVLLRLDKTVYQGGETVKVDVFTTAGLPTTYLDVIKDGQVLLSKWLEVKDGKASHRLDLPEGAFGTLEVHAYQILQTGEVIRDSRVVYASPASDLRIKVSADQPVYQPGAEGVLKFEVTDAAGKPVPSALGVLVVDEAVYALQEMQPGLEKVFFTLQKELLQPKVQELYRPAEGLDTLIQRPALDGQKQQIAQVLLTAAQPKPPARWHLDPAAERRQKVMGQVNAIAQGLMQYALTQKTVVARKKGATVFADEVLEKAVKAGDVHPSWLDDRLGGKFTLDSLATLEAGCTPERLARTVTQLRLLMLLPGFIQSSHANREKWVVEGKWTFPADALTDAANRTGLRGVGAVDGWGNPIKLVKRSATDKNAVAGAPQLDAVTLGSAGPDGEFGTADDLVYANFDYWSRMHVWYLPEDHRALADLGLRRNRLRDGFFGDGMGTGGGAGLGAGPRGAFPPGAMPLPLATGRPGGFGGPVLVGKTTSAPTKATAGEDAKGKADGGAGPEPSRVREFFPETLLWRPALLTDDRGQATLKLPFADSITTWRLSASASSRGGQLGGATMPLRVFQDFFVDVDLPVALTQNDEVAFPVAVYNYLKGPQTVALTLEEDKTFELTDGLGLTRKVDLKAGEVAAVKFRIRAKKVGMMPLLVKARGTKLADAVKRSVEVLPDGVPVEQVFNDRLTGTVEHTVNIPDVAIDGASRLFVKVYPGVMAQVVEGTEGMLRMPNGCFEQTSSSAYPNVLVVDYIKKNRLASPALLAQAEQYLSVGYQRLLTFERRPSGGFDWWGSGEPLIWLSAYGLQEFNDMARVWPVDRGVIERTKAWLLKQQDADGTWSKIGATHGESIERMGDPKLLLTSYVTWAILDSTDKNEAWRKSADYPKLKKAVDYIRDNAPKCDSAYILALAANALASWDAKDDSTFEVVKKVLGKLNGMKERKPEWKAACFPAVGGQSLSYAQGDGLTVETTSLAVLAMLKSGQFPGSVNECLAYLARTKGAHGTWGSTQATILAMKALVSASTGRTHKGTTPFVVKVNGKEVATGEVTEKNADVMQQFDLRQHLKAGPNVVALEVKGETTLMYQVVGRHFHARAKEVVVKKPALEVEVAYDRTKLSTADVLKAKATVRNNRTGPAAMVMVDLAIPPGFVVDAGEFAELVAAKKVQKFSVTSRQVTLYLNGLAAGAEQSFEYVLRPKYPIRAQAPASVAWEYYTPSNRGESRPVVLVVEEKK